MYLINKPRNQYMLAGLALMLALLQITTTLLPISDFVGGFLLALGIGLLIAAYFCLKLFPEKTKG